MSSLSDIMTAAKNIVTAINGAAQTYLNVQGAANATALTATTLVKPSAGRVAVVSVLVAGSAPGSIYDANSTSLTTGKLFSIPNTVGITVVNMPVSSGIVVAPGTGQTVSISYS